MSEGKNETGLVKVVREKGQYLLAFGVIASLLVVANIPIFVVFFFAVFAYFMAKMFSAGNKSRTRAVFEFYLSAHEILRDDLRRWYGFEINETIARGEQVLKEMHKAPPLVHFALGSLYNKIGDHSAAVKHLAYIAEDPASFEGTVVYPTPELRNYVSVLRKIEREPAEAPLTSAAVRTLERSRKLKTETLLTQSRTIVNSIKAVKPEELPANEETTVKHDMKTNGIMKTLAELDSEPTQNGEGKMESAKITNKKSDTDNRLDPSRKPITEVLHDIYDRNTA